MNGLAKSYPTTAMLAVAYLIILYTPLHSMLPEALTDAFIIFGLIASSVMLIQIIIWSASGIRESVYNYLGASFSNFCILLICGYLTWAIVILISLYKQGA
jgi:hypothetical protein